jgi:hypothetical protein
MKTKYVLQHFNNSPTRVAEALGISRQAVSQWSEIVPLEAAMAVSVVTHGALVPNPRLYPMWARAIRESEK